MASTSDRRPQPARHRPIRRAFLIYAPTGIYLRDDRCQAPLEGMAAQPNRAPLDLGYIAASLEAIGIGCKIRDYSAEHLGWQEFEDDFDEFKPDLLLVSVTTPTLERDLLACVIAKRKDPSVTTVAKGAHFSGKEHEVMHRFSELDFAIRGASEYAVAEIAQHEPLETILGLTWRKDGALQHNPDRPCIEEEELDRLPFPARHLMRNDLYRTPDTDEPITLIDVGRGCPHQCVFCPVSLVSGPRVRLRSPDSVVQEIEECLHGFGIRNFFFRADTFTCSEEWTVELCQRIVDRGLRIRWGTNSRVDTLSARRLEWMKRAGCWVIGIGFESGNDESLRRMKKRATCRQARDAVSLCHRYGVKVYGLFVIGFPWEDRSMIEDTFRFMREIDPDFVDVNIAYPLPGTELYSIAKERGLFREEDLAWGDYARPVVRTADLSADDLVRLRRRAILSFYSRPRYVARTLAAVRSPRVFANYLRAAVKLLRLHGLPFKL